MCPFYTNLFFCEAIKWGKCMGFLRSYPQASVVIHSFSVVIHKARENWRVCG